MKYFHLNAEINSELMAKFFDFCNDNSEDDWTIVILSDGGTSVHAKTIIHIINQRAERVSLILEEGYSAGFDIFYLAKCKKYLCDSCRAMVHMRSSKIWMQTNNKPFYDEDKSMMKYWQKNDHKERIEYMKKFLTASELALFKAGHQVYLEAKRLKEIFPDADVI